jgi:hypothetical protein
MTTAAAVNALNTMSTVTSDDPQPNDLTKKRKRLITFTPRTLQVLNEAFKKDSEPTSNNSLKIDYSILGSVLYYLKLINAVLDEIKISL